MKWIALPILAAVALGWSGFLDRLEATTIASQRLAQTSEEAPDTTRTAAEEVGSLPDVADLTTIQADTFKTLGDALQVSAERVSRLNDALGQQEAAIDEIVQGIGSVEDALGCVGSRLRSLLASAERVPGRVGDITATLDEVERIQRKSIRHLKSINRKLTALGVAAEATDVKPPPRPDIPDVDLPQNADRPIDC